MAKRIAKDAVVGHKTVTKAATNLDEVRVRRQRRKAREHDADLSVSHTKVHPEVWAKALELCEGNPRRIEVVGPEDVVIHNHAR